MTLNNVIALNLRFSTEFDCFAGQLCGHVVKTATPKRRLSKTASSQNGDKPKRRQVNGEITETTTNQKVDIAATQYERVKE